MNVVGGFLTISPCSMANPYGLKKQLYEKNPLGSGGV
jgi:hypothetical protein